MLSFVVCCVLSVACWSLFAVRCLLRVVWRLLFVACRCDLLFAAGCSLIAACCLLCDVGCLLAVVCCPLSAKCNCLLCFVWLAVGL